MFILTSGTIGINRRWAVPTYPQSSADLICLKHCPPYLLAPLGLIVGGQCLPTLKAQLI
ncbi:MAG: hypothetical protein F6K56_22440 [Moorea sp. SIO3G5]|nr:hypothetical protein [Moorena sp. SIO3G5]